MGKILSVRLGDTLEHRLTQHAEREQKTQSEAVREAVEQWCRFKEDDLPLDVLMADYIGCIEGDGHPVGRDHSRLFGDYLEEKRKARRL